LIIHVLSVVIWIGGVAFVTMVMFPVLRRAQSSLEQVLMFQAVEHKFARIARVLVILSGLTGGYMLYEKGMSAAGHGLWPMLFVWSIYAMLLFFLEPVLFRRLFPSDKKIRAEQVFFRLQVFHWFVLTLSLSAIAAGVWSGHY
jgi:uncharacterized membrane protein